VAELLTPFLQFYFIREPMRQRMNKDGKPAFSFLNLMQKYFDRLIDFCFRHPYGVMGVAVVSVVAGMGLITILPQKMMPTAERNQFAVEIYLPYRHCPD
jgi:multidrug efflux pump subunit AcrB